MRPRRSRVAVAIVVALVLVLAGGAFAGIRTITGAIGGASSDPGPYTYVQRQDGASLTASTTFVTIPGALAPVSVTDGSDLILGRFSAESACYPAAATTAPNWCSVRLIIQSQSTGAIVAMYPQSGFDYAFDSTNQGRDGASSWEGHSMDRSIRIGNGNYYVIAQQAVTSTSTRLRLDDWSLTVEKRT
jgi:hypothetical protein